MQAVGFPEHLNFLQRYEHSSMSSPKLIVALKVELDINRVKFYAPKT